jgi:minor extracellular serine protease Vpr
VAFIGRFAFNGRIAPKNPAVSSRAYNQEVAMFRVDQSNSQWLAAASAAALALGVAFAVPADAAGAISDAVVARVNVDVDYALVQLNGDPLATYSKTKPAQGKKIDFNSATVKSYRALLSSLRNDFKRWLRANAPKAKVTGEFDLSLNAVAIKLNGESLSKIGTAPQVLRAQYQGLYYPNSSGDPDLDLINATEAWTDAGDGPPSPTAGEGVKVAIVDSGIDITHPCFNDAGYPAQTQLGDHNFTNNKVIAAKVFNNKTPSQHYTAEALDDHGTHVSGTVACNYGTPANVNGVPITHPISGVAPRALLGNYNVFPAGIANARSEDILNALDAAYADGFDIANMSLGGGAHGIQDLLTIAVDNLDRANMVVAVAAGNSGPGHYTVESPGSAARALTAGAATVGHIIASTITVGSVTALGVTGDFATVAADLTRPLGVLTESPTNGATGLSTACGPLATDLTGKIALLSRGVCSFSIKIRNAQAAHADAVIVVNNVAGDGIGMATDGTPNQPTIPAYNVSITDGAALATHGGEDTTVSATLAYFVTGNDDFMASFSGQGPTDVDFRVKPDVVAPGVNVLSSIPHQFCGTPPCFAFFQGTSMATPHLAGSAAVLRWAYPTWSAAEIRSAVVNTAAQGVLKNFASGAPEHDVQIIGAGREDLQEAVNAMISLDPVSVSFGAIPSGSGQSQSFVVTVGNLDSTTTLNVAFAVDSVVGSGVGYSVAPAAATIAPGTSAQVTVTMSAAKGAAGGDHRGRFVVSDASGELAHAVVYTFIK